WGGFIPDIAGFDPSLFNVPPGEAAAMDPRQRLLLMSAWQTLADAGYAPQSLKRSNTGVFVALQDNEYVKLLEEAGVDTSDQYAQTCLLANRLSYFFDFRGASEVVDAQCPGGAVAIHRAVNALRLGEIDQALVGAANLLIRPEPFALLSESGQLSPTDSVRSFGADAQGHLRAEGVASLLLKPLSRALADKDHIYALIRGSAVNYNGQGGASIAAPNVESHVEVIRACYRRAGIDPRQVRYIEAQGMGNVLADLVEWQAFNRALGRLAEEQQVSLAAGACRVSTVKPMMGHMESASALGALFKIVRSLQTGVIHKVVGFTEPHPDMETDGQPCAIATETLPWPRTAGPRLAGLHGYGMGGINAHLLIEEFDPVAQDREDEGPALIVLSARSAASLAAAVRELREFLTAAPTPPRLHDIAYTLQMGREAFEHRLAWVVKSHQELLSALTEGAAARRQVQDELHDLAARWMEGEAISWSSLYAGKDVRRVRLPAPPFDTKPYWIGRRAAVPVAASKSPATGEREIRDHLIAMLSEALAQPAQDIDPQVHLYDLGIDSLLGMKLLRGLSRRFDIAVQARELVEHPTIEALSRHLAKKRVGGVVEAPVVVPARATPSSALSEGQKGLWTLQQLEPGMAAYNIPLCFHLARLLDVEALKLAFRHLLDEQPVLGSVFVERDGTVVRETRTSVELAFERQDVSALGTDELMAAIRSAGKKPFDLARGPLVRLHVFSRGPRDHHLLLTLHHIVFDGGSFLPVCRTLFGAYREIVDGKSPKAATLSGAEGDFASWEQEMLAGAEGSAHRAYWARQLSGDLPVAVLFTDFPRAASQPFAGQSYSVRLSPLLSQQLRVFARQQRMNLSTLFLAFFNILLHRYTGQGDIIVGMAERGRAQDRFETAVGYFINMLPIRARDISGKPLAALLHDLQFTMADALDHAAYPFPRMVRDLGVVPGGAAPVFQVAFEYQNAFSNTDLVAFNREFRDTLGMTLVEEVGQEGEYELVLEVREGRDDFVLNLKFNPTLFKPETIARLAEHLVNLAGDSIAHPHRMPAELDLLSGGERKLLLDDWNATRAIYPRDRCFHQLFEQQARMTPDAVALICEDRQLTYAELDARSTVLAKYLQHVGVQADQPVAVCVDRSLDMVVAMLGVAKSGGAWLPLDPKFPAERLRFMLEDSGASVVLTQSALQDIAREVRSVVALDTQWAAIEETTRSVELQARGTPRNLAYVIYTSGSTGTPKGVMVEHQALMNFLCSMASRPGFEPGDRLLAVTTYSFDIAGLELLLPLVRGGTCCICPSGKTNDAALLRQEIRRLRPTIMQATPSTWTMLFHDGWCNEERMKLLCGGEPLPPALKREFVTTGSDAWNMFGPTETTIWSTVSPIAGDDDAVDIGTPIANTQIHVLDRHGQLAPMGLPGELCIGGDGLARGYLNRPELTAERFAPNPFEPGTRLYRTGDLARWREDGVLEHLGRLDHQVKIRGFRIELEEIETWLAKHPAIERSVVVARGQQLVAYLVSRAGRRAPTSAQVKEFLAQHLPEYMIPAISVALTELPLTASGKIDRKSLADRDVIVERAEAALPVDSTIEREVLALWQSLLNVHGIGVT
ncbi:MAG TPA: amino acid adenylation domain-containing protein, partial [Reyranella sp.]|nr:amino acid adenylation domain-containing protein [Reyranella sp.]